jgi:hypothetical protein
MRCWLAVRDARAQLMQPISQLCDHLQQRLDAAADEAQRAPLLRQLADATARSMVVMQATVAATAVLLPDELWAYVVVGSFPFSSYALDFMGAVSALMERLLAEAEAAWRQQLIHQVQDDGGAAAQQLLPPERRTTAGGCPSALQLRAGYRLAGAWCGLWRLQSFLVTRLPAAGGRVAAAPAFPLPSPHPAPYESGRAC